MPWSVRPKPQQFDEAIENLRKRVPMRKGEWEQLQERARQRAFTVAGITQLDLISETKQSLVKALERGQTLEEWKKGVGPKLEAAWQGTVGEPAHRLQTIFQTNIQTQYNRGHEAQASHPAVKKHRPFKRFVANVDADTTEVCLQADGTVLPADDPWWDSHTPPLHFNCRSTVVTLSPEEAEEYGVTESPTELPAQEGFGHKAQEKEQAALDKWEEGKLSSVGPVLLQSYKGKKEVWEQAEAKRKEEQGQQSEPAEPPSPAPAQAPVLSEREYQEEAQKRWKDWKPNLTQDEHRAVRDYTDTAYENLNQTLRAWSSASPERQGRASKLAELLDNALAKSPPLRQSITVFRGSDYFAHLLRLAENDPQLLHGKILVDPGFLSASASREVAADFGPVVAEIRLPAGTRAGFLEPTTKNVDEFEVLLPRRSRLRIVDARIDGDGTKHLQMELVQ